MVADDVIAGVVCFNPDLERLRQNLDAITPQVPRVVIFDNGSQNAGELEAMSHGWPNVEVVLNGRNDGIAYALNELLAIASAAGAHFFLSLDQDSVATSGMVDELRGLMGPRVAMSTPLIVDRNKPETAMLDAELPPVERYSHPAWRGALTSGALVSVKAATEVGGFDDRLFIDYVDYDLNARLMLAGYEILRANSVTLLHEVGEARRTWLFTPRRTLSGSWRIERFHSFGHSPFRCYYKARNRVIFTKKYGRQLGVTHEGVWQIPQQVLLTVLFENHKRAKLAAFARGIRDGVRFRVDPATRTWEPTQGARP